MPIFSHDPPVQAAADLRSLSWLLCGHFYAALGWIWSRERAPPRTREGGSSGPSHRICELHSRYGDVEDHCVHGFRLGSGRRRSRGTASIGIWGCDKLLMVCFLLAVGCGTHASSATSATCFIDTTPRTRSSITSENLRCAQQVSYQLWCPRSQLGDQRSRTSMIDCIASRDQSELRRRSDTAVSSGPESG